MISKTVKTHYHDFMGIFIGFACITLCISLKLTTPELSLLNAVLKAKANSGKGGNFSSLMMVAVYLLRSKWQKKAFPTSSPGQTTYQFA